MCQCLSKQDLRKRHRHNKRISNRYNDDNNGDGDDDDNKHNNNNGKLSRCQHRISSTKSSIISINNNDRPELNAFNPAPTIKINLSKIYTSISSIYSNVQKPSSMITMMKKSEHKTPMTPSLKADLPSCDVKTILVQKNSLRPMRSSIFDWNDERQDKNRHIKLKQSMVIDKQQKFIDAVVDRLIRKRFDGEILRMTKKPSSSSSPSHIISRIKKKNRPSKRKMTTKPRQKIRTKMSPSKFSYQSSSSSQL